MSDEQLTSFHAAMTEMGFRYGQDYSLLRNTGTNTWRLHWRMLVASPAQATLAQQIFAAHFTGCS